MKEYSLWGQQLVWRPGEDESGIFEENKEVLPCILLQLSSEASGKLQ